MRVGVERVPGTCGRYRVGLVADGATPRDSERFVSVLSTPLVELPRGKRVY